jgi:hypothetical protein
MGKLKVDLDDNKSKLLTEYRERINRRVDNTLSDSRLKYVDKSSLAKEYGGGTAMDDILDNKLTLENHEACEYCLVSMMGICAVKKADE